MLLLSSHTVGFYNTPMVDFKRMPVILIPYSAPPQHLSNNTPQKMKITIKDFFSKDFFCSFLPVSTHLLKNPLIENFIFFVQCNKLFF